MGELDYYMDIGVEGCLTVEGSAVRLLAAIAAVDGSWKVQPELWKVQPAVGGALDGE